MHREYVTRHRDGRVLHHVELVEAPDSERDLRESMDRVEDIFGAENTERAERSLDRQMQRPPWSPMDTVPHVGPIVRDLGYIDPADFTRSW